MLCARTCKTLSKLCHTSVFNAIAVHFVTCPLCHTHTLPTHSHTHTHTHTHSILLCRVRDILYTYTHKTSILCWVPIETHTHKHKLKILCEQTTHIQTRKLKQNVHE